LKQAEIMTRRPSTSRKAKIKATTVGPKPTRRASEKKAVLKAGRKTFRAKIRIYRQRLGDCFLVTLPRSGHQGNYHILIDCGVILGTPDAAAKMTEVLQDVASVSSSHIDLLIATHQHWDHLSGFIQAAKTFDAFDVKSIWMAWTENPQDELAKELAGERDPPLALCA
jgi:phosphoribosyl 1,2-cyclic phosphodiesterase